MQTDVGGSRRRYNGEDVSAQAHIAQRCEGAKRRAGDKKKARQRADAPSNKTYGNCLLGFHCSHKDRPENRAVAGFLAVAQGQQDNVSTAYQQIPVEFLGTVFGPLISIRISPERCRKPARYWRSSAQSDAFA
jgi:hypothetical protein